MSTAWMLYWWTRLDGINQFLVFLLFAFSLLLFASFIGWINADYNDSLDKKSIKSMKFSVVSLIVIWALGIFIPSQKDMAIIVGGQVATNIVQSPEAKELGNKALAIINGELDKRLPKSQTEPNSNAAVTK